MPTKKKKRKIPELVQAHLERRAQQNTTMAERHVAALGKSAREQLKVIIPLRKVRGYARIVPHNDDNGGVAL